MMKNVNATNMVDIETYLIRCGKPSNFYRQ